MGRGVGHRTSSRVIRPARRDPVDFFAGHLLAVADLVDHVGGRLGQERSLPSLRFGARQFLLRGRQILFEPAPFGGDVDGARRVQLHHDGAAADSRTSTAADGVKPSSAAVSQASDGDGGKLRVETGRGDVGQPRGHPLPVVQSLVAAEPAHLGDQLLHIGDPLCRNGIHGESGRLRPVGDDQRLAAGQRLPQHLGDERHHRVQQFEQRVEHRGQHRGGVCDVRSASCTLASSTYQSQNSSQAKWYSDSHARLNS